MAKQPLPKKGATAAKSAEVPEATKVTKAAEPTQENTPIDPSNPEANEAAALQAIANQNQPIQSGEASKGTEEPAGTAATTEQPEQLTGEQLTAIGDSLSKGLNTGYQPTEEDILIDLAHASTVDERKAFEAALKNFIEANPGKPVIEIFTKALQPESNSNGGVTHSDEQKAILEDNFVYAQRGDEKKRFNKVTWDLLKGSKDGWKKITRVPPEVEALNKKA